MKKLLAMVLALTMLLGLSITAFAADADDAFAGVVDELTYYVDDSGEVGTYYGIVEAGAAAPVSDEEGNDTIKPAKTIYFEVERELAESDLLSVKFKKEDGAKLIDSIKLVEKKLTNAVYADNIGGPGTSGERCWYIAVKLKDSMADDETKISFSMTVKAKKDLYVCTRDNEFYETAEKAQADGHDAGNIVKVPAGTSYKKMVNAFWMNNKTVNADYDGAAGTGGLLIKQTKNDDNEYLWEDANNSLVKVTFAADNTEAKIYSKLSTKWTNDVYAELFPNTDAFIRSFVSNPKISSASRATVYLYNPFINADGDETCDPDDVRIYVKDGDELEEVTSQFKYDDDEQAFYSKARELGTYVITGPEGAATEEAEELGVPTGIVLEAYAK